MNMFKQKQKQPNKLAINKYPDTYQLAFKQLKHLLETPNAPVQYGANINHKMNLVFLLVLINKMAERLNAMII